MNSRGPGNKRRSGRHIQTRHLAQHLRLAAIIRGQLRIAQQRALRLTLQALGKQLRRCRFTNAGQGCHALQTTVSAHPNRIRPSPFILSPNAASQGNTTPPHTRTSIATHLSIRSRQALRQPELPHLPLLVRANAHRAPRQGAAQQHVSLRCVLRKILVRVVVLHPAFQQSPSAGQAAALMTDRWQHDPVRRRRIPDALVLRTVKGTNAVRRLQLHPHITGYKTLDSCCKALRPARLGGSARTGSISHRAHAPAAR
jgi:hypothetical protein